MRKYFSIEQAGREAHLYIFGDIVAYRYGDDEVSAFSFQQELSQVDADLIHVHIDSYGGSVSEGWAIYNTLKKHPAKIVTHAEGFVASAALYPFMAGDQRIMSSVSALFFHQVIMGCRGNADDLRAAADQAEKLNDIGIVAFTDAGITQELVLQLEKADTWVSPVEALNYGFATAITGVDLQAQPNYSQSVKQEVIKTLFEQQKRKSEKEPGHSIMQMLAGILNN